jgi:hypothetical protein
MPPSSGVSKDGSYGTLSHPPAARLSLAATAAFPARTGLHVRPANFLTQDTIGYRVQTPTALLGRIPCECRSVGSVVLALHGLRL